MNENGSEAGFPILMQPGIASLAECTASVRSSGSKALKGDELRRGYYKRTGRESQTRRSSRGKH